MDYLLTIFVGLAVWRLTRMFHKETGPLNVFMRMRALFARRQKRMGGLFDMFNCFYCLSVWVAMIPALLMTADLFSFVVATLVLSTIAVFTESVFYRLNKV